MNELQSFFGHPETGLINQMKKVIQDNIYGGIVKNIDTVLAQPLDPNNEKLQAAMKEGLRRFRCLYAKETYKDPSVKDTLKSECRGLADQKPFQRMIKNAATGQVERQTINIEEDIDRPAAVEKFDKYVTALCSLQRVPDCGMTRSVLVQKLINQMKNSEITNIDTIHQIVGCFELMFLKMLPSFANMTIRMRTEIESALYSGGFETNMLNSYLSTIARQAALAYGNIKSITAIYERFFTDPEYSVDMMKLDMDALQRKFVSQGGTDLMMSIIGFTLATALTAGTYSLLMLGGAIYNMFKRKRDSVQSAGTALKPSAERVYIGQRKYVVYLGPRGKKYVRKNKEYVPLSTKT